MLEKPDLADAVIQSTLEEYYGITIRFLNFLPLGNDAGAWVYRVDAEGGKRFFLKVRTIPIVEATLVIPHTLYEYGIKQVVAPLLSQEGKLWHAAGDYGLIVYPYIQGGSGMEVGLTLRQWIEFGTIVKRLHSAKMEEDILHLVPVESFYPRWSGMVRRIQGLVEQASFRSENEALLAKFWQERSSQIKKITRRTEELGLLLRESPRELVLCHADIHTANLLVDLQGELHIVDWDQPVLAPKERDLMFVVDGGSAEEKSFFLGYGSTSIDPLALAYYRYEWVVQELGDYGERVFFRADLGIQTVEDSLRGFRQLFDPGDVVDSALATEALLS